MGRKRKKIKSKKIIILLVILALVGGIIFGISKCGFNWIKEVNAKEVTRYLASDNTNVKIFEKKINKKGDSYTLEEVTDVIRGTKVKTKSISIDYNDSAYVEVTLGKRTLYVDDSFLVKNDTDIVLEKEIYVRTATAILENTNTAKIVGLASKSEKLEVLGYDKIDEKGIVNVYQIKQNDVTGYVYGKYMVFSEEEAGKNYNAEVNDAIHSAIKNSYGGGEAIKLDFYPVEKPSFEDNVMPEAVYALYLNNGSNVINNIDAYIEFAKDTKINAFVVDIKDNTTPGYPSQVMQELSYTNYEHAINSYDNYKGAITKLKEAGFYVIGRITTFKDDYYVTDHPEDAISSVYNGKPYKHAGSYWPSPYDRDVWYFNVSLAKEAITEMGFNEINFDYVRFPDRMLSVESSVDMHNTYNEDKVEAIQRFVRYAKDEIHKLNAYVSIDVFGESTNGSYTTAYGQYWPAISNEADVMSGMPYPDHFSTGYYGIAKPWNNPYQLMNEWASDAYERQQETTTPAVVRTWIQAYDVLNYVDPNGIDYNANELEDEIRGLYDANITGGYVTWLSSSNIGKYKQQKAAFQIDYLKEYNE